MNSIDKAINKLNDYKETIESVNRAMAYVNRHYRFERWIKVDNEQYYCSVIAAVVKAFKHLNGFFGTNMSFRIDPETPTTWLDRSFKECLEEIQTNIMYLGDYYIDWLLGIDSDDDVVEYMQYLFNDIYYFVERFAKRKYDYAIDYDGDHEINYKNPVNTKKIIWDKEPTCVYKYDNNYNDIVKWILDELD